MADWTVNAEYSRTGNGTNVCPTKWIAELQDALPVYDTWRQFTTESVGGDRLVQAGIGDTIKVNYFDNINVLTSSLSEGTYIPRGSQASTQVEITIEEEGHKLDFSGLQEWLTPSNLMGYGGASLVKNAVQRLDYVIGAKYVAATSYFSIYGTDTFYENNHTGTRGTEYVYPTHVRQIRARLARLGVEPFNVGGQMLYAWVAPPGAFEQLQKESSFYEQAARLGESGPFKTGLMGVFGGFAFYEENGANASTTYSTTVGTSCLFGAGACIGNNTLGGPDFMWLYNDVGEDAGRNARAAYKFRQGYSLTLQGTLNARPWLVYHKM